MKGIIVLTKRSGYGYVYDHERNGSVRVKVHLVDSNFEFTGKIVRSNPETLKKVATFSR